MVYIFAFRFMSKRRLLVISAPSEMDYSFQQQLSALAGQECHLGENPNTLSVVSFFNVSLMPYGNVMAESGYTSDHQEMQTEPNALETCLPKDNMTTLQGVKEKRVTIQ